MKNKEIFISYKRDGGSGWAELVRLGLIHYTQISQESIFLDVHDLTEKWKKIIKSTIRDCTNVIVVISKDIGKKIHSEDDWFIEEISEAIQHKRVIIPLLVDGITEDSITNNNDLPELIKDIVKNQFVRYRHDQPQGAFISLKEKFRNKSDLKIIIPIVSDRICFVRLPDPDNRTFKINESNHFRLHEFSIDRGFEGELIFQAWQTKPYRRLNYHLYIGSSAPISFIQNMKKNDGSNLYFVKDLSQEKTLRVDFNWYQKALTDVATPKRSIDQVFLDSSNFIHKIQIK